EVGSGPFAANGEQFLAALRKRFRDFLFGFLKVFRSLQNGVPFDEDVFAAEFIMGIASFRCVAVRLHAVMEIENLTGIAEHIVDFFSCPDVESAFLGLAVAGITDPGYNGTVR